MNFILSSKNLRRNLLKPVPAALSRQRLRHFQAALLLAGLAAGAVSCTGPEFRPAPTYIPQEDLEEVIELTAQALLDQGLVTPPPPPTSDPDNIPEVVSPTAEISTPIIAPASPTATLDLVLGTPSPASLPDPLPLGAIQIISPGRLSRVISPFRLHLYSALQGTERSEEFSYLVSLYGEGGELLERRPVEVRGENSESSHLVQDYDFEIAAEASSARLEITAADPYSRIAYLVSTDIILLREGEQEIKSILDLYADIIIEQPIASTLIQGEALQVNGVTRLAPGNELLVELLDRSGNQVGSAVLEVEDEDLGFSYRAFSGEVPYQVSASSWIRVQVIARDGQFSGLQSLSSVEVLVSP